MSVRDTRVRVLERFPGAIAGEPPADVRLAIDSVVALLHGEARDLSSVALDMNGVPPFFKRVYETARRIPTGSTSTYGDIASQVGSPGSARAVGQALGRNPFAILVPCHRVLAANGKIGGFSANGGIATKRRLLALERPVPGRALWAGYGSLGFDPEAALAHVRTSDDVLSRLIEKVGPFRLRVEQTTSLFAALAEAIVYQQLTAKAAGTIFARVCALFPCDGDGLTARHILGAPDEVLRRAGLSRPKALALRDLARKSADGEIPTLADISTMEDEAIVRHLTRVRGIGRWTVEMLLIFRLGRPDVLPVDDYGIRKGYAAAFRTRALPTRADLERRGARWTPYRTVASWYLWRAAEQVSRGGPMVRRSLRAPVPTT
jgi:O-6-methylguanine DNA methyltransferase